jgi:hypothetical protein
MDGQLLNEFNWFVKDDWKVRPNLTINLGLRWDLFRVPYFSSISGANWTRGPIDGGAGWYGISGDYRDFLNRKADYTVSAFHRTHIFRANGIIELPFGPGRFFGGDTTGFWARLIEGWQLGGIFSASTGSPLNIPGRNTINRNGTPDIVGDFDRNGEVKWGAVFGNYFTDKGYSRVADPIHTQMLAMALQLFISNLCLLL